jgi:pyruvate formate lyase activating enzyme
MINYPVCISCGACTKLCTAGALSLKDGIHFNSSLCSECGRCIEACSTGALRLCGRTMKAEEVIQEVLGDQEFFEASGGGVTLSGGEVMLQDKFACAILKDFRVKGIHTAVETSGYAVWPKFERIKEHVNLFLYDIKAVTAEIHEKWIGVQNEIILANFINLKKSGCEVVARIPLIPGVNDGAEFLRILDFLKDNGQKKLTIIPYHRIGRSKYQQLGYGANNYDFPVLVKNEVDEIKTLIADRGFENVN